jgi:hypothetical protein
MYIIIKTALHVSALKGSCSAVFMIIYALHVLVHNDGIILLLFNFRIPATLIVAFHVSVIASTQMPWWFVSQLLSS